MSDFLFERDEPLDQTRAYTRIDFNQAILGNRWIERTWSGFFGTTTSLVNRGNGSEWVVAQNPEFSLVANGDAVVPIDLGEIDVTEECSDLGASLIVRKGRADLNVTIISTALHDVPAMIRSVTVQNTGADPGGSTQGISGTVNTGGGAGAGGDSNQDGGSGGSGIVIIRYAI